mmetsp:Transcript_75122/g.212470  ORF Transcript_75122/g.212470 Transcript_75122/m.212470 type:complete len:162 (-) Transcript_75122:213-698(-)
MAAVLIPTFFGVAMAANNYIVSRYDATDTTCARQAADYHFVDNCCSSDLGDPDTGIKKLIPQAAPYTVNMAMSYASCTYLGRTCADNSRIAGGSIIPCRSDGSECCTVTTGSTVQFSFKVMVNGTGTCQRHVCGGTTSAATLSAMPLASGMAMALFALSLG